MINELVAFFQLFPGIYFSCLFLLGLCVGSFLNVVIYRLPVMMQQEWRHDCLEFLEQPDESDTQTFNLLTPRSRCGHCGHLIKAGENIPVLSYLILRGKCAGCSTSISIQYPLVEILVALISLLIGWHFGVSFQAMAALVFSWCLIAASGIDIGHKLLPDSITLPLLWLGLLLSIFNVFIDLQTSVIGAMAGYLSLWSVYIVFKWATGKEGMGHGDFKLLAMLGAWIGWKLLFVVILTASLVGATVGITMILLKKTGRDTQIPFGPYLATAGWLSLLWGEEISQFYFKFL